MLFGVQDAFQLRTVLKAILLKTLCREGVRVSRRSTGSLVLLGVPTLRVMIAMTTMKLKRVRKCSTYIALYTRENAMKCLL